MLSYPAKKLEGPDHRRNQARADALAIPDEVLIFGRVPDYERTEDRTECVQAYIEAYP